MTSEQIAELRTIADEYVKDQHRTEYRERETALAALPKILDEREALLKALKALDHHPHNETSECWRNALSAIAKAESP